MKKILRLLILFFLLNQNFGCTQTNQWESEVKAYEKLDSVQGLSKGGIVFTGSSSIRMWENLPKLFVGKKIVNRGIGGSELTDISFYAEKIIFPYQPKKIFIYCGSNDIANGKSPEKTYEDFKDLYSKIRRKLPNTKVYFISLQTAPVRNDKRVEFKRANELVKSYLTKQTQDTFIDVYPLLLDDKGMARPEFFGPDQLHMNQKGYDRWARVIRFYVEQ